MCSEIKMHWVRLNDVLQPALRISSSTFCTVEKKCKSHGFKLLLMQLCPIKLDFQFIIHCWSRQRPQQAEWNQFIRPGPRLDGAIPQSVSSGCLLLHTKGEKVVRDFNFLLSVPQQPGVEKENRCYKRPFAGCSCAPSRCPRLVTPQHSWGSGLTWAGR